MSYGSLFLPPAITLSDNEDQMRYQLQDLNARSAYLLNSREIAIYAPDEVSTGQAWYLGSNNRESGFRKVIQFGALPNATSKSVVHGITISSATVITNYFAVANNPTALNYKKLPYVDCNTLANSIQIDIDQTNVTITTAIDYTAYTICYVVIEYLQT